MGPRRPGTQEIAIQENHGENRFRWKGWSHFVEGKEKKNLLRTA